MDRIACYRAISTRDVRFDGRLFVGVKTTGIYCRPICPARTPKFENVSFFSSAAAAQEAGFRPCLRCRPEVSPELAFWRGTSNTVSRALALIEAGGLDGDDVEGLANRLGIGGRQLRRLFQRHLGASPVTVAQTRRVLLAKQLIHETSLPMAEVALASGFNSVRRFNETFRKLFARPPAALRHLRGKAKRETGFLSVRLAYRPPYDWDAMLAFLAARAIPGLETISGRSYKRSIAFGGNSGVVKVTPADSHRVDVAIRFPDLAALPQIIARVRRVFDLAADPDAPSARAIAPGTSSSTRNASRSSAKETAPRYADPSASTSSARSAGSSVRVAVPPSSFHRPSFHGQKASRTSKTTEPAAAYARPESAAPTSTRRTQSPSQRR